MNSRLNLIVIEILIGLALCACATVPRASKEKEVEVKKFSTHEGKSNIYIFRDEYIGGAIRMNIDMDGKEIGKTIANTFLFLTVEPGKHTFTSHAENDSTIEIEAIGNKNYYIWQEVKMGVFYARNKLQQMNEEQAMPRIKKCELVENTK